MRTENWLRMSLVMGVFALLAVVTGHLALTDIHHADGDLSLEWNVLRVCFTVIVLAQALSIFTLIRVLRRRFR